MTTTAESHVDTFGIAPDVYRRRWLILAILNLSLVTIVIAVSSLNVALPTIQRELGASGTELQWIVDAYALVFAGFLLPAGALGDRFGRKGALECGLVIFGGAALVASQSTDAAQLIGLRSVMGLGAALIMPATLSIILNSFPIQERPKAIAIWAAFAGVGGALGPITSGLLLEHFWWGSVFMATLPVVAALLLLTALFVPTSRDPSHTALDPIGSGLSVIALVGLVFAVIEGPELGWTHPATIAGFVAFVVAGFAWVRYELAIENPILDPRLFRVRAFSTGAACVATVFLCTFGMFFLITQFFQFVQGYTPLQAGVRQLPYAITLVLIAPAGRRSSAASACRPSVRVGCWMGALGFAGLATLHVDTAYWFIARLHHPHRDGLRRADARREPAHRRFGAALEVRSRVGGERRDEGGRCCPRHRAAREPRGVAVPLAHGGARGKPAPRCAGRREGVSGSGVSSRAADRRRRWGRPRGNLPSTRSPRA